MKAYETQSLIMASHSYKNPQMWLWNFLIGKSKPQTTMKFEIQTKNGRRLKTPLVGRLEHGKLIEKNAFAIQYISPPMIKPYTIAEADDITKQQFGEDLYGNSYEELIENKVAEETQEVLDASLRTKQWMLATLLTTGVHPMHKGNSGIVYGTFNTEVLTGTDKFNDPACDIYAYLKQSQLEVQKATGIKPDSFICEPSVASAIQDNEKMQKIFLRPNTGLTVQIDPKDLGNGGTYIGFIPELNLTIYSFIDWVSDDGTTDNELIPEGGSILCSKGTFEAHYGAFKFRAKASDPATLFVGEQALRVVPSDTSEDDELQLWSAPVVVPRDAQAWKYIKAI
ncbi:MAG: major capsid protein [Fusobacteriaceae bacterium]